MSVTQLHRAASNAALGPFVQHGLAMHADEVDVAPAQAVEAQEPLGGLQMLARYGLGASGEDGGLRRSTRPAPRGGGGLQRQVADSLAQLALTRRPKGGDGPAVGLQHGHIDRVEGSAGHEAQDAHR